MSKEKSILNWEDIKDKLFLRLENRGKSMEVPDERIRIPFLDLVVFIYCDWSKTHWEGVYVNRNHLILWKQDKKDVLRAALRNTFQKDNIVIPITDLLSSAFGKEIHIEEGSEKDMIVLTSRNLEYGAAMLLNTPELKKLADRFNSDLYLLPSSVHEILAVRTDQNRDISLLMDMVQDANQTVVRDEDYLSDCIYYFDRKKCEIKIAVPTTANIR